MAHTPLWLLLLRLVLVAALIVAASRPVLNADRGLAAPGPLVVVVDDGWAAAKGWAMRTKTLAEIVHDAERQRRPLVLLSTAAPGSESDPRPRLQPEVLSASKALEETAKLQPKPWPTNRLATLEALREAAAAGRLADTSVVWLSDGLEEPAGDARVFVTGLSRLGPLTVIRPPADHLPVTLRPAGGRLARDGLLLERPMAGGPMQVSIRFLAADGRPLAEEAVTFGADQREVLARPTLPLEWLTDAVRAELVGEDHAAGVLLLAARWGRRPVGIATAIEDDAAQPLLAAQHYLTRALEGHTEIRRDRLSALLEHPLSMIVVVDELTTDSGVRDHLSEWVDGGGILVRFAGPRLARSARASNDPLMPVPLLEGQRSIGGSLSWERPLTLLPFEAMGPFHGLHVPDDVTVWRQVLADPASSSSVQIWARLSDGTPLVTARRQGQGWIVLVHTSANAEWTNLPLSGLFGELLARLSDLSDGVVAADPTQILMPEEILDGFGRLQPPPAEARPIRADALDDIVPSPVHPPGFYGTVGVRRALNLAPRIMSPTPLPPLPAAVAVRDYEALATFDLRPWLLGLALGLVVVDLVVSMILRGLVRRPMLARVSVVFAGLLTIGAILTPGVAFSQVVVADGTAPKEALATQLAYVVTGRSQVDQISRAGLLGLTLAVNQRTAAELEAPVAVRLDLDRLEFYPLLYWPLDSDATMPPAATVRRLRDYLRSGGTIVFDTRGSATTSSSVLHALHHAFDLLALVPTPADHLLKRAFYLLDDLPGRWAGDTVWVERDPLSTHDGVSQVILGSHDWAGAWAVDETTLRPILPVVPGGEWQRELAYRFGINLVMHVLTGSYKADQVHLPTILERLRR